MYRLFLCQLLGEERAAPVGSRSSPYGPKSSLEKGGKTYGASQVPDLQARGWCNV